MNKILPFVVLLILLFGVSGAGMLPSYNVETFKITKSLIFPGQPKVEVKDDYLRINYDGANSKLMIPNKPELPIYIKTFTLPKEAQNIKVSCTIKDTGIMKISGQIIPIIVYPLDLRTIVDKSLEKDEQLYQSNELYPSTWYSYDVGRGLDGKDHVIFVKIVCNVIRYNPALSTVEYIKEAEISVRYDDPGIKTTEPDIYDMVIIAPKIFVDEFQPLVDHKNSYGLNTTIKTVEEILDEYDGYDAPEKIKYFIKYAIEEWGITYVLLGGGLKSHLFANDRDDCNQGTKDWYVPVRYTNIIKGSWKGDVDCGCLSDLYYADIYTGESNFSSWDSNGDGIFAAWDKYDVPDDDLDLYPDVYVARLPCRNKREVKLLVNKIIVYESTYPESKPWFKKMIAIAGCTHEIHHGQPDGEYICDTIINCMSDLIKEPIRIYASNRNTGGLVPTSKDILDVFYRGAGFVIFQGHGDPYSWLTRWDDGQNWTGRFDLYKFWRMFNGNKLPVVVVGGCHNGLFNVTIGKTFRSGNYRIQSLLDKLEHNNINLFFLKRFLERILLPYNWYWTYGTLAPFCFSWGLCLVPWGGAIATTGFTGYGWSYYYSPISLSAELETDFFYEIGQRYTSNLAHAHGGSITMYLNENYIDKIEAHCITVFHAFGDPSLKFGGYP